ncbi:hypothetical protein I7R84_06745 [Neisseria meningitidis]|nr:hypothetical protein [Neisseria meningitidis]
MTVQELFNVIPLWQVAHIMPHEAERRSQTEYTEKEIADWAARIGNIN